MQRSKFMAAGFGLLEIVLAVSIISIISVGLILIVGNLVGVGNETVQSVTATILIEETAEAVRLLRDNHWSYIAGLTAEVPYYLVWTGHTWATSTTPVLVDGVFERSFRVVDVERDANDNIVTQGGVLDPNTRQVTVTVAWWSRQATTTRSFDFILTNLFNDEV